MITNLGAIRRKHSRLVKDTRISAGKQLRGAGEHAQAHVKNHAKFKSRTGRLAGSTRYKVRVQRRGFKLSIFNRRRYAAAIDQGARPHIIVARRRKFLRFVHRGRVVFARSVRHPGNRPYKFLYRATNAAGRVFSKGMRSEMNRLARGF